MKRLLLLVLIISCSQLISAQVTGSQSAGYRFPTGASATASTRLAHYDDPGWGFWNRCSLPIFVPTRSWAEFSSVINNHPSCLYTYNCDYQFIDFGIGNHRNGASPVSERTSRFCCQSQLSTMYTSWWTSGTTATLICCFRDTACQRYYYSFGFDGPDRSICCTGGRSITNSWLDEPNAIAQIECC